MPVPEMLCTCWCLVPVPEMLLPISRPCPKCSARPVPEMPGAGARDALHTCAREGARARNALRARALDALPVPEMLRAGAGARNALHAGARNALRALPCPRCFARLCRRPNVAAVPEMLCVLAAGARDALLVPVPEMLCTPVPDMLCVPVPEMLCVLVPCRKCSACRAEMFSCRCRRCYLVPLRSPKCSGP